jgi:4-diphosphocytidyl-2-C-methyl-D-erythritol kinase
MEGRLSTEYPPFMLIHQQGPAVRVWSPAKLNLFLEVLGRRADGYHDLATLMVTIGLFDTVELRENATGTTCLHCDSPNLSTGPDNLVCRAIDLVRRTFNVRTGLDVRLFKRIPLQAGLAGGSSNAAAVLAGLNHLWRLGLSANELGNLGAELGSDVTFFFFGPAAWCTGRGEVVEPLPPGRPLDFVLVCPPVGLSTAAVFRALRLPECPVDGQAVRLAFTAGDVNAIGRSMHNRLQEPAEELCPAVAEWRGRLAELRPAGTLMSGSGSTVFALATDAADASRFARALRSGQETGEQVRIRVVRSCD